MSKYRPLSGRPSRRHVSKLPIIEQCIHEANRALTAGEIRQRVLDMGKKGNHGYSGFNSQQSITSTAIAAWVKKSDQISIIETKRKQRLYTCDCEDCTGN